jgi:hypothetical protein
MEKSRPKRDQKAACRANASKVASVRQAAFSISF